MPQVIDAETRRVGEVAKLLAVPRAHFDRMGQETPELLLLELAQLFERPVSSLHQLHEGAPAPRPRAAIDESVEKRRGGIPKRPPCGASRLHAQSPVARSRASSLRVGSKSSTSCCPPA